MLVKCKKVFVFSGLVLAILTIGAVEAQSTSGTYFTGSGGEGMTLAILVPDSNGLDENQAYLPRMVQGGLVRNTDYIRITTR